MVTHKEGIISLLSWVSYTVHSTTCDPHLPKGCGRQYDIRAGNVVAQFKNAIKFWFLVTFAKLLIHVGMPKEEKKCKRSAHCACVVSLIDGFGQERVRSPR